jgi:hypothetical protein
MRKGIYYDPDDKVLEYSRRHKVFATIILTVFLCFFFLTLSNISALVTPNDCQRCHPKAVKEFNDSLHSKGATFVQRLDKERGKDDFLAYVVEGKAAAVMGYETLPCPYLRYLSHVRRRCPGVYPQCFIQALLGIREAPGSKDRELAGEKGEDAEDMP